MSLQIALGARVRKSPFFDATIACGVTHFSTYNHMFMATSYGDPDGEYEALTERVAIWDVACERQVEVVGPDALALVQYLSTRDMETCPIGQARYTPICDHDGILINDPVTLRLAADRFWISLADGDLGLWAQAIAAERGLDCRVFEPDVSPLAVQGPRAEDTMASLLGDWARDLKFFAFTETDLEGIPFVICRSGWSGQGGFELFLTDGSRGLDLWDRVWEAGLPHGIRAGTPNASERIESELFSYRCDCAGRATPLELGLERFMSLDRDDDFVGRAALRAERERGVSRRLVKVKLSGDRLEVPSQHPWPAIGADGSAIGEVRVAVWSPALSSNLALALVSAESAGSEFTTVTSDGPELVASHLCFFGEYA
ncbi:MAG: glycine cleavage T C-terminal barrel domain-containing protein [Actinomycetota bacterium]|nr:glycine cleavage T C-terminal barrel domain-containing protein [Actinomycetota bacterium]